MTDWCAALGDSDGAAGRADWLRPRSPRTAYGIRSPSGQLWLCVLSADADLVHHNGSVGLQLVPMLIILLDN